MLEHEFTETCQFFKIDAHNEMFDTKKVSVRRINRGSQFRWEYKCITCEEWHDADIFMTIYLEGMYSVVVSNVICN